MEIETTPWYETRTLVSPAVEMLQKEGLIQYKKSYLKTESPQTANSKPRFIHYDANYVKYCFLKEFYQFLFDGVRQGVFSEGDENELLVIINGTVTDFIQYCGEHPSEEDARELFRTFCKIHLFR
ncbi:hypothetical protein QUB63_35450 [Microcoleus sp. ARI1-B5]|uniref:hypothetical protein n=1 Tax=unclassified Microcoleus TaxID=2642155 RepID=UPI002FD05ECB